MTKRKIGPCLTLRGMNAVLNVIAKEHEELRKRLAEVERENRLLRERWFQDDLAEIVEEIGN